MPKENADKNATFQKLIDASDTEISYALCIWLDENIDIPSFAFRKSMLNLNPKNSEAFIFVMVRDGLSAIKLLSTVK